MCCSVQGRLSKRCRASRTKPSEQSSWCSHQPVAVVGDIKLMFHQCFVEDKDQRFLRFLWWPKGDTTKSAQVHAMTAHLFGATSSPSVVGFCMRKTADDNESAFSETAIDTLRRSFYVDDMLRSVPTVEAAKKLIPEMKSLLDKGGFKLTKFIFVSPRCHRHHSRR